MLKPNGDVRLYDSIEVSMLIVGLGTSPKNERAVVGGDPDLFRSYPASPKLIHGGEQLDQWLEGPSRDTELIFDPEVPYIAKWQESSIQRFSEGDAKTSDLGWAMNQQLRGQGGRICGWRIECGKGSRVSASYLVGLNAVDLQTGFTKLLFSRLVNLDLGVVLLAINFNNQRWAPRRRKDEVSSSGVRRITEQSCVGGLGVEPASYVAAK